jgi:hypothetical protein
MNRNQIVLRQRHDFTFGLGIAEDKFKPFHPLRPTMETLSRQYRWQVLQKQLGNCPLCGRQSDTGSYCLQCAIKRRERQRKKSGAKRRYNAASYRVAAEPAASTTFGELLVHDAASGASVEANQGTIIKDVVLDSTPSDEQSKRLLI